MRLTLNAAQLICSLGLAGPASAFGYCQAPSPPSCPTGYGTFDSKLSFDQCLRWLNDYQREVDDYLSCLQDEQKAAVDQYNRVIAYWNCKADDPTGYCSLP